MFNTFDNNSQMDKQKRGLYFKCKNADLDGSQKGSDGSFNVFLLIDDVQTSCFNLFYLYI